MNNRIKEDEEFKSPRKRTHVTLTRPEEQVGKCKG